MTHREKGQSKIRGWREGGGRRVLALTGFAALLAGCSAEGAPEIDTNAVYAVPLSTNVTGPGDALVTIVEAGDFQCPYCKQVSPTVSALLEAYPQDLRLSFMHMPLSMHAYARPAAIAAECAADQDRFWEYHDALFAGSPALADDDLRAYAEQVGLDVTAWSACIDSEAPQQRVDAQRSLMLDFGVASTPSFFINGRYLSGARSFAEFQQVIDVLLSEAHQQIEADGIAAESYYTHYVLELGIQPDSGI